MRILFKLLRRLFWLALALVLAAGGLLAFQGYRMYRQALDGQSLEAALSAVRSAPGYTPIDQLPELYLDAVVAVAVHDEASGELTVFAANRDLQKDIPLEATLRGFEGYRVKEFLSLESEDLLAENSAAGEKVRPIARQDGVMDGACLQAVLHKASWNVIRLGK